jgi:alpha-tubulin suppressor-like RCC1 family protein
MNGSGYCWGYNTSGQVGVAPNQGIVIEPVQAEHLTTGATAISANFHHTCGIANDAPFCWGSNEYGELGLPPQGIATSIAMGHSHSCFATDQGVFCSGFNAYGQLGNGGTTDSVTSVKVKLP